MTFTTRPPSSSPMLAILAACVACVATTVGCRYFALATAKEERATTTRTAEAIKADALFWETFHGGRYDEIPAALEAVTAAYLGNPADPVTAAHAGWLHIWRLSESGRLDKAPATITDDAVMVRKYFDKAVKLNGSDARYLGFLAGTTLAEASIHHDERQQREGYFMMRDAIKAWPEFNLFTGGYVMSRQPAGSDRYQEALEWQWQNLDACAGETVDRATLDYAKYMTQETLTGNKRVCWNSWIAPHNFEGFFLNMGDMLVKSGDWLGAQKIYANAKLSRTYSQWKFGDVLDARIRDAQKNVALFSSSTPPGDRAQPRIMIASTYSCTACHQQ